ncbi:MAG: NADH-quinone oxidoreductase subunit L [Hyphomonadaceae bacterium]|nr:NADH-quinone oxidoreductase subunit L [Hyphomonadaceae bacterium]MBC6412989.1 NADH-quinone oxidoreductase subunit L [Hyphomonadaceae bacterium]
MLYKIIVFAPLLGCLITGFLGRRIGDKPSMTIATGLLFLSAILSWVAFFDIYNNKGIEPTVNLFRWMDVGGLTANWALKIDMLTGVMLVVVTTVSALVHLYSWGYMENDPGKPRFFAYLSLFTFAMLMLVTADNFIQLFFGWEGVGLASYLLIGFWYKKPSANAAAIKAFVTNRVGDVGFALGVMAVFFIFGSVNFDTVFATLADNSDRIVSFVGMEINAVELIAFLLFVGAMGKSAQFILHVWLPDAMEGPTPVSALIHAATMVTAGVFLVCRVFPIYEMAPVTAGFITVIGAFTALFAATVALVQNDIKRVIAYSTCSQLGYMFFAAGVGAYSAAMFHLFTHAFFKALLFLGAGSVIHALHHEQDMRKMGGTWKVIPLTYMAMIVGTLALTGVGFPGIPGVVDVKFGFAGFHSKDLVIESAYAAGTSAGVFAFWAGVIAALMTSFYSWRLIFMTFHGRHRVKKEVINHARESPGVMLIPLFILSIGAMAAGSVFHDGFVGEGAADFWRHALPADMHADPAPIHPYAAVGADHVDDAHGGGHHDFPLWVLWAPVLVSALGFITAWFMYIRNDGTQRRIASEGGPLYRFLLNKWYIDELYDATVVRATRWLGDLFWKRGDKGLIDRFGPDGIGKAAMAGARRLSGLQSGYLYHYAFVMLLGLAVIIALVFGTSGG